jgi:hypothetical protein
MNGNLQLDLPVDVVTKTLTYTGGSRISEWKLPLSSIAGLATGNTLKWVVELILETVILIRIQRH